MQRAGGAAAMDDDLPLLLQIAAVWAVVAGVAYGFFRYLRRTKPQFEPGIPLGLPHVDFMAKVAHVIDGDTVDVVSEEGRLFRIRLSAIDCPEDGQALGDTATAGLIKLIGGKTVFLENHDVDQYGRIVATIFLLPENSTGGETETVAARGLNVNERMVALGHAWVYRQFYDYLPEARRDTLNRAENWARTRKVGLWRTENPIPPWEWRMTSAPKAVSSPWQPQRRPWRPRTRAASSRYRVWRRRSHYSWRRGGRAFIPWPVLAVGAALVGLAWLYDSGTLYRAGFTTKPPSDVHVIRGGRSTDR